MRLVGTSEKCNAHASNVMRLTCKAVFDHEMTLYVISCRDSAQTGVL